MSAHTPGPWKAIYEGSGDWVILDAKGEEVAAVGNANAHFLGTGPAEDINESNAKLIAASPVLLEKLKFIAAEANDPTIINTALSAIAIATE